MAILVRHYLMVEPDQELDVFLMQYTEALWMEERLAAVMTNAMGKAFNGK
jgi:hypothetical protein